MDNSIKEDSSSKSPSMSVQLKPVNKAASIPIAQKPSYPILEKQVSAPSYFESLKENVLPPFELPGKEPKPRLLIGTIFAEEEIIAIIGHSDVNDRKLFIGKLLVEKNVIRNFELRERKFLVSLILETIDYSAQRDFNLFKLTLILTIYIDTHIYFKWYYWQPPLKVWDYFKEIMIRHTIEDSPTGQEVFEPEECYDILTHFHTIYLSNLPLIHVLTFGAYQIKYTWPFKAK